jgi:hypothetical protein
MFMGMKITLAVEVNGAIVDLDLAKFGSSLPQLEKLKLLKESSAAEAMELMKDFPGMKIDLNSKLKVVFRQ